MFGPPAVGKTAAGTELAYLLDFKLLHVHMTIDLLTRMFDFGSPSFLRLHRLFTLQLLEEAASQGISTIVTTGWNFDAPEDTAFAVALGEPFIARGGRVHYVELTAPLAVRLQRNRTAFRTTIKNTAWATDDYLRKVDAEDTRDSGGSLPLGIPHLRLETEEMSVRDITERIASYIEGADRQS